MGFVCISFTQKKDRVNHLSHQFANLWVLAIPCCEMLKVICVMCVCMYIYVYTHIELYHCVRATAKFHATNPLFLCGSHLSALGVWDRWWQFVWRASSIWVSVHLSNSLFSGPVWILLEGIAYSIPLDTIISTYLHQTSDHHISPCCYLEVPTPMMFRRLISSRRSRPTAWNVEITFHGIPPKMLVNHTTPIYGNIIITWYI